MNVSFTVEGVGDTLAEKLNTSLYQDVEARTTLEACIKLGNSGAVEKNKLVADVLLDCSSFDDDKITITFDDENTEIERMPLEPGAGVDNVAVAKIRVSELNA